MKVKGLVYMPLAETVEREWHRCPASRVLHKA
jgi:hypothetical protein